MYTCCTVVTYDDPLSPQVVIERYAYVYTIRSQYVQT